MDTEHIEAEALTKKETPRLIKFHILQGFNYVFACSYFAYLALYGSEAKPKIVSSLWMQLEDPPLNPLERTLLAMFWLCPACIGLGYLLLRNHTESVYGSFLTAFMGGTLSFRVALTPAQYLTLIIIPVDFGGILYKLALFKEEFWAIPKESRVFLWNVPGLAGRPTNFKLMELESYIFAVYTFALSFVSTDRLLPGYEGTRVAPFSKIFFVTQAVIFVFAIPGLRQGKKAANFMVYVNKYMVSYFLIKGIFYDKTIPNMMGVWLLLPYVGTLVFETHLYLWRRVMQYSIFSEYVTRRQASSAKYFTTLFAVLLTTVSNVCYVCTGTGLASIGKTYGSFLDRLAFLPGGDTHADQVRFYDIMIAGMLFLFVIALEEVLDKKNTAESVARIHFVLTVALSVMSLMLKVLCNLEVESQWHGGDLTTPSRYVGVHCIFWAVNVVTRLAIPLACLYVLCNVDGPVSAWVISMKVPKKTKSPLTGRIVADDKLRKAIKRTMIFHGIGVLMFASVTNSVFTAGLPTYFPEGGLFKGGYIIDPLLPDRVDDQMEMFYVSLVISFTTVIIGSALATIKGKALPLAQAVSAVWPVSIWAFLLDSWWSVFHNKPSRLAVYIEPLFRGSALIHSQHMTSVAIVGMGSALLSLIIVVNLKVKKVSVYNRKVQSPADFAMELSYSHKQSYLFHSSVLVLVSSIWMLRSCRTAPKDAIGGILLDYLCGDMISCIMLMNFGFVISECKHALTTEACSLQ